MSLTVCLLPKTHNTVLLEVILMSNYYIHVFLNKYPFSVGHVVATDKLSKH